MESACVGRLSSALSQAATGDAPATLVLRKAMAIQAQGAMQLIEALPKTANPLHLGSHVEIRA